MSKALDQARLEWVCTHLELVHEIYELAHAGDPMALAFRKSIWDRAHLTETQLTSARQHVKMMTGKVFEAA